MWAFGPFSEIGYLATIATRISQVNNKVVGMTTMTPLSERRQMRKNRPYLECPRFEKCSENCCPLDPEAESRVSLPGDPETKCNARISTRKSIAAKYGLPNRGMSEKEIRRERLSKAKKAWWASLPEEEKQRRLANLKPRQKVPVEAC